MGLQCKCQWWAWKSQPSPFHRAAITQLQGRVGSVSGQPLEAFEFVISTCLHVPPLTQNSYNSPRKICLCVTLVLSPHTQSSGVLRPR